MEKVVILMSTYNGERYIKQQLDSILSQKYIDVHIIIRDDGSTDNTKEILEYYSSNNKGLLEIIYGDNIGWKKSFMSLVDYAAKTNASHKYYAFSDQDDIWMPDKLSVAVKNLVHDTNGPKLYCSNLFYYKNGITLGLVKKFDLIPSFKNCLIKNLAAGCTIVFNNELLKLLANKDLKIDIPHDYWAYMVANLCGKVFIDKSSHILYRQHEANQIGSKRSFIEIWKRRLNTIYKHDDLNSRENAAKELLRIYGDQMSDEPLHAVSKIANYRSSLINRLSVIFDNGYTFGKISNNFWLKIHLILGTL